MATVRAGNKGVLLIVDVQVGVMRAGWDAARVVANIGGAVERARARGVPVLWVQHQGDEMPPGSAAWQWVPELVPAPGEAMVHKRFNSAFEDTALEDELARIGATHIVLAGAQSNWCIRATAHGALERGYDLTLLKDAHTTESIALGEGRTVDAADIVRELNTAMTWLEYPGRRNGTAKALEVDFAAPGGVR